jgi:ABC-2 type transport system permease protein
MPTYEVLLTAWMYLTPVIYPVELVPEGIAPILRVNPMFYIVKAFRTVLQGDRLPDLAVFGPALLVGAGMLVIGWWLFTRRAREYAYHV